MRKLFPLMFLIFSGSLIAQTTINIALVDDHSSGSQIETPFKKAIQEEILQLLQHRYTVQFNDYLSTPNISNIPEQFALAYATNDILIAVGTTSSNHAISLNNYPKPTIASIVIDFQLQGLNKTDKGSSGISNFTYLESPFNIKRDINLLHDISPYEHLVVFTQKGAIGESEFITKLFSNYLDGKDISVSNVIYNDDLDKHFADLGDKKTAAYAFPYLGRDTNAVSQSLQFLNKNKIPSAALFGETYLAKGALVGYETSKNLQKIPRRIALNVMKIIEGQKAADLNVEMQTFGETLILNMETARQIEIYPDFDLMAKASLINLEKIQTDNRLTLHNAIAQALKNNLDIRIEQTDINISGTEIAIAKADLLPQLSVSSNLSAVDELTAFSYQGAQGRVNWLLSGQLSQILFSEPILANVAIQKMLKQNEEQEFIQKQLDVVIDVANAYINILFAKSNLNIHQENVARNKENYDISKAKQAIGYTGASDINRWEAELANANIDLNSAYASLRQGKFQLNQLLNRPIDEAVEIEDITLEESMLLITDNRTGFINNYGKLDQFANFLVTYARKNLPELAQIDIGTDVQKRLQLSRQRALYLPSLALNGSANRVLGKYAIPEGLTAKANASTWNIGLGLSYPIFQGNSRRKLLEQSKLKVLQLQDIRKNTQNQLELRTRANMETVGVSFSRMELSQTAADASRKNYLIVQNAYAAGQSNITTLIDAQNNSLFSELAAINSVYTFILDFLMLERSIGYYHFLATPSERDAFFQQLSQFLN